MDYIITTYPTISRKYLVKDVNTIDEAWEKYYNTWDSPLVDEDYADDDGDIEIELLTPELRIQYGLEEE